MDLKELVHTNRSYRRFYQNILIEPQKLRGLVNLTRFCASSGNLQPLRYVLSYEPSRNALIFPHFKWAGYYSDWASPPEGERPSAYIIILNDVEISPNPAFYDAGIAAQTILLGAAELGLGGCIIGAIQRQELGEVLQISPRYEILLALALGKPKGTVRVDAMNSNGDTKYWRDAEGVHHVPKRNLNDIILREM